MWRRRVRIYEVRLRKLVIDRFGIVFYASGTEPYNLLVRLEDTMKRLFACLFAFSLILTAGTSYGQIPHDLRDFYQYEDGAVKRLEMAPKIYLRFIMEFHPEAREKFINELAPLSRGQVKGDGSALVLGFDESIPLAEIVRKINKAHTPTVVEARPVFWVNNIEAVADGVVVEPKTPLTELELRNRIARFGAFEILKSEADGGGWIFFTDGIAPPLNLFILTNLIHKDAWVKRARLHFRYLHDPIVSEFRVEPISGTVGEPRKFIWTIRIFDPKIKLNEQMLPSFGEGRFMPIQLVPAQYGPPVITPPAHYLFRAGKRERFPDVVGKRSRTITFVWHFAHYALGEWTVGPQSVAYEKDGVSGTTASGTAKLVVTSLIGDLAIDDMPPPAILRLPERNISEPNIELLPLPVYLFDRWTKNPEHAVFYGYAASIMFGWLACLMIAAVVFPRVRRRIDQMQALLLLKREICGLCDTAEETFSYDSIYDALAKVLSSAFPQLSRHPTVGEIEDTKDVVDALGDLWQNEVKLLLSELERRSERGFKPDPDAVEELVDRVRELAEKLDSRMAVKGGV